MDIADAFEMVLDLAKERLEQFDQDATSPAVRLARASFIEAINMVEDFVVNELGDD